MDEYLKRRIWDKEKGVSYFCTICGEYKPESQFYKNKKTTWGIETRCKDHYIKKNKEDNSNDHIRFTRLYEKDFQGAKEILQRMGYDTTRNIHQQFMEKHKHKIKQEKNEINSKRKRPS